MNTEEIKIFYNTSLKNNKNTYEKGRWFRTAQSRAGYTSTKRAMQKHALQYLKNDMKVFELGPGPGTWTKVMLEYAPQAKYSLVDISEEMLKQAKDALSDYSDIFYTTSDILKYQAQDEYDFFFSSRILEYVPEKDIAIKNIVQAMHSGAYGYIVTKTPQEGRVFSRNKSAEVHSLQISSDDLESLFEKRDCIVHKKIHVTCVFPKMHSGLLDSMLTRICNLLPFAWGNIVSESYAIIFQKK